jgi:hypothetical protein
VCCARSVQHTQQREDTAHVAKIHESSRKLRTRVAQASQFMSYESHIKPTGVRYAEHSGPNVSGRGGCGMQRHAPTYVPIAARAE